MSSPEQQIFNQVVAHSRQMTHKSDNYNLEMPT